MQFQLAVFLLAIPLSQLDCELKRNPWQGLDEGALESFSSGVESILWQRGVSKNGIYPLVLVACS